MITGCVSGDSATQRIVFTARRHASAVYAVVMCVCLSVISRCSTETAKRRITQTTPHDSAWTLGFGTEDLGETQTGSPLTEAPNTGGVG